MCGYFEELVWNPGRKVRMWWMYPTNVKISIPFPPWIHYNDNGILDNFRKQEAASRPKKEFNPKTLHDLQLHLDSGDGINHHSNDGLNGSRIGGPPPPYFPPAPAQSYQGMFICFVPVSRFYCFLTYAWIWSLFGVYRQASRMQGIESRRTLSF